MIKKFITVLIFTFILSCGYSPVFQNDKNFNFKLDKISYIGDKKLNRNLEKNLELYKKNESVNIFDLDITSFKNVDILTKDEKGNATSFKTKININIVLTNKSNDKTITKNFSREKTYNSMDNKFELSQYRLNLEKNILSIILQEIKVFLSLIENDL
ncbi:hypothetical protein IDG86_00710 [Pelagibacterales bacterium SAG-MED13]|nr:hypothetical protein [Pelagibacterales bacterium SAG-MED13]|tara:strand:+ start:56 stop:526 length:471 start_codon:yes stop_codon:yes gene_type:complete